MPYTITLTDGTTLTTVADNTVDTTTTSVSLLGRNFAGYGGYVAENTVHQLENFSNTSSPTAPLVGQLWYNSSTLTMNVWNGTAWVSVGFPSSGFSTTTIGVENVPFLLKNDSAPANQRLWSISVSDTAPYIGMLVFQALNDDLSVKNTVMALDGVNNIIIGAATYS